MQVPITMPSGSNPAWVVSTNSLTDRSEVKNGRPCWDRPSRARALSGNACGCWDTGRVMVRSFVDGRPTGYEPAPSGYPHCHEADRTLSGNGPVEGWTHPNRAEVHPVASVAEVKAAIEAAVAQVNEGQAAIQAASEKLAQAAQTMAAALDGSGHELVGAAQAALAQADTELQEGLAATLTAVERAQTYAAGI